MPKAKRFPKTLAPRVPLTGDTRARRLTFPGMASWGGEGPPGKCCRECQHWDHSKRELYFATGLLKPQACLLAERRMQIDTPKVPHYALACKEFVPNPNAPPAARSDRDAKGSV